LDIDKLASSSRSTRNGRLVIVPKLEGVSTRALIRVKPERGLWRSSALFPENATWLAPPRHQIRGGCADAEITSPSITFVRASRDRSTARTSRAAKSPSELTHLTETRMTWCRRDVGIIIPLVCQERSPCVQLRFRRDSAQDSKLRACGNRRTRENRDVVNPFLTMP